MSADLINVPFIAQQQDSDCLVACAAMCLTFYGKKFRYQRLAKLLQIEWFGTPFSNIARLKQFNLHVSVRKFGDFDVIRSTIQQQIPLVASIQAGELPYNDVQTDHAVIIVGIDDQSVYLNDPMLSQGATPVSRGDFALAWLEHDEKFATVSR